MVEKENEPSKKDDKIVKQSSTTPIKKMPFDPTKWCDYHKCIGHDRFNYFALLRMQKYHLDQQTSKPNSEQEIY